MSKIEASVTIDRPIDIVFGFFADPRNDTRWVEGCEASEQLTAGPIGVGTRFRQRGARGCVDVEVTEFVPGKRWSLRTVRGAAAPLRVTHRFEGDDRGTRVTCSVDVEPRGALDRLAAPVVRLIAHRRAGSHLLVARDLLEQRSMRPPA